MIMLNSVFCGDSYLIRSYPGFKAEKRTTSENCSFIYHVSKSCICGHSFYDTLPDMHSYFPSHAMQPLAESVRALIGKALYYIWRVNHENPGARRLPWQLLIYHYPSIILACVQSSLRKKMKIFCNFK